MKARYKYILGRKKSQPELLELEVYFNRTNRVYISTKINVPAKHWDSTRQVVSGRFPNAISINNALSALKEKIEKAELDAISQNKEFTKQDLRIVIGATVKDRIVIEDKFNEYLLKELTHTTVNENTQRTYFSLINSAIDYFKSKDIIYIDQLNHDQIVAYQHYLTSRIKPTSITSYMSILRKLCLKAFDDEYLPQNIFAKIKLKNEYTSNREGITEAELATLERIAEEGTVTGDLAITLDKFLFSCYTGLRISDNDAIKKSNLIRREEGFFVDYKTIKTGFHVRYPLWSLFEGKPQRIAEKYMQLYPNITTLFPTVKRMTVNLNCLEDLAKTHNHLTFHVARHTCATLLAHKSGNPFVIQNVLGHSDIKMSMNYIHDSAEALIDDIAKIKW